MGYEYVYDEKAGVVRPIPVKPKSRVRGVRLEITKCSEVGICGRKVISVEGEGEVKQLVPVYSLVKDRKLLFYHIDVVDPRDIASDIGLLDVGVEGLCGDVDLKLVLGIPLGFDVVEKKRIYVQCS